MLEELGHPQTRTPIQTDNSTAHALLTNKILPKALKAMDMRFHWLCCFSAQDQYRYYWRPGTQNLADYWTKHHPAKHHNFFADKCTLKFRRLSCQDKILKYYFLAKRKLWKISLDRETLLFDSNINRYDDVKVETGLMMSAGFYPEEEEEDAYGNTTGR
jgi:hypothetical protein